MACWNSLECSRWVLTDEYPYAMVYVILTKGFSIGHGKTPAALFCIMGEEGYLYLSLLVLTLMLLVAGFTITKWSKKNLKWPKPWYIGTHLRVLSESYPMNTNMTWFRWFSKIFASLFFGWK